MRIQLLAQVLAVVAMCATANDASAKPAIEKSNIVLIVVGDLGVTDVDCFGSDVCETPNIDTLCS